MDEHGRMVEESLIDKEEGATWEQEASIEKDMFSSKFSDWVGLTMDGTKASFSSKRSLVVADIWHISLCFINRFSHAKYLLQVSQTVFLLISCTFICAWSWEGYEKVFWHCLHIGVTLFLHPCFACLLAFDWQVNTLGQLTHLYKFSENM